jgi:DNA-binding CsgD family transcriptional regulator
VPGKPLTTRGPAAVVHADLDGDGTLDIAVVDLATGDVSVWTGDATAGYQAEAPAETLQPEHEPLTPREREVAALMMAGYTDPEIAARLRIGRRTAETHAARVRAKLGVRSRRELRRR